MINLFGEAIADVPRQVPEAQPKAETSYMVWSWYAPSRHWKSWPNRFTAREGAERWVERELSGVTGHTHYVVVEIRLAGSTSDECAWCGKPESEHFHTEEIAFAPGRFGRPCPVPGATSQYYTQKIRGDK